MDNPIDENIRALKDDEILTVEGGYSATVQIIDAIGNALVTAARGGGGDDSSWTFLPW